MAGVLKLRKSARYTPRHTHTCSTYRHMRQHTHVKFEPHACIKVRHSRRVVWTRGSGLLLSTFDSSLNVKKKRVLPCVFWRKSYFLSVFNNAICVLYTLADMLWVSSVLPFDVWRENKERSTHLSNWYFHFFKQILNLKKIPIGKWKEEKLTSFRHFFYGPKRSEPFSTSMRVFVFVSDPLKVWDRST